MSTVSDTAVKTLLNEPSSVTLRPGYEGGNINTAIGFKHVCYLIEHAVLDHFRAIGLGATKLYLEHGLNFDVVGLEARLITVVTLDDEVTFDVLPKSSDGDSELRFAVTGRLVRGGERVKAVAAKVTVRLRQDETVVDPDPVPDELARFATPRLATAEPRPLASSPVDNLDLTTGRGAPADDPVLAEIIGDTNAFGWKWRIPYYYCHFTERMQMSGYLRQMEEAKHLFVASRGISIKKLLDERGWIPVVTQCKLTLTDEAIMEEDVYTVYTVENIFKNMLYTSRMDCYVVREGRLVQTATGSIVHGYAAKPHAAAEWEMPLTFDDHVLRAIQGTDRPDVRG
ncbi:hypothetical protein [Amycolatopsis cihanbeyliensis]|uniref:Acyl-CoA thioesterase FadM n=1 Tax=Amycolatopsis cihanbeyliensis TaxID=1128664 RepID=A0A542DE64_AMYCI|nr:hypothetical protein [Amycolatopsis cihanbeyliensis]TQJ01367.1 hypothetical protein FB471_1045 [Amycolatopsis cihanbeyliensis]